MRITLRALLFVLLFSFHTAWVQPQHTQLLLSDPLDNAASTTFASLVSSGGIFITGQGWQALTGSSQLVIALTDTLPHEATVVVDVKNFNPVVQNTSARHYIINLYSQSNGNVYSGNSNASWMNIRTGTNSTEGAGAGFHFFAAPRGISSMRYDTCMLSATWNLANTYTFKIVWNNQKIYCYVDDVLQKELSFVGQTERFKFIFLGKDNTLDYPAQPGPIYSNLRIYVPEGGGETPIDPVTSPSVFNFTDITSSSNTAGNTSYLYGHGVSFADVDGDSWMDIFVSNAPGKITGSWVLAPDLLYINGQDGLHFDNRATQRHVNDPGSTHPMVNFDFDNDGDLDVYYSNMQASDSDQTPARNKLYENNKNNSGKGYYTDVTSSVMTQAFYEDTRGVIALDIDNDGDQDIFEVGHSMYNKTWINSGNRTFSLKDRGANGSGDRWNQGCTAADIENDGDVDIYVCRRPGSGGLSFTNWLYINDGSGHFTEAAAEKGVAVAAGSPGATFGDVDNDGDMDLFVIKYANSKYNADKPNDFPYLNFFKNRGDGIFYDNTAQLNIHAHGYTVLLGDFDNDADLDLFVLQNQHSDIGNPFKPKLYRNDGSGGFSPVSIPALEITANDARGVACGDIDKDGDLDIYITDAKGKNHLIRNETENEDHSKNHYVEVLCIGPKGDYGGFGTKVYIYKPGRMDDPAALLGYQEAVSHFGFACQNQQALHFGLGGFTRCDVKLIFTDGVVKRHANIQADTKYEISQNSGLPVELAGFSARAEKDRIELSWQTATETNNLGFSVERSESEQGPWQELGFVNGAGTTSQLRFYSYIDSNLIGAEKYFYRLRQEDFDGTTLYSPVISVTVSLPQQFLLRQNYPNPFNPWTVISYEIPATASGEMTLTVFDLLGRKVRTLVTAPATAGYHESKWDGRDEYGSLAGTGVYFYELKCGEWRKTHKMIKID